MELCVEFVLRCWSVSGESVDPREKFGFEELRKAS